MADIKEMRIFSADQI